MKGIKRITEYQGIAISYKTLGFYILVGFPHSGNVSSFVMCEEIKSDDELVASINRSKKMEIENSIAAERVVIITLPDSKGYRYIPASGFIHSIAILFNKRSVKEDPKVQERILENLARNFDYVPYLKFEDVY